MTYLALTTLAVIGFLTAAMPSTVILDRQAQERQETQSNRNLLNNQTVEIPEVSPEEESARTLNQLCPVLIGLEPNSWEYREALDQCEYGSN